MKKIGALYYFTLICYGYATAQERIISDCVLVYDVTVTDSKADAAVIRAMSGSKKILYIKGSKSRSELVTPNFILTTLTDTKTDSTVILRELGTTKYITYLNDTRKKEQNKKYEGIQFTSTDEKKVILGYECKKVVAKLADSSTYNVFYASTIIPSNRSYEYEFRDLPGFVLEYEAESEDGKTKIKYAASKITLGQVPAAKFDLPKMGFRVL